MGSALLTVLTRNMITGCPPEYHGPRATHKMFLEASRYVVDFAEDFFTEGWQQFDTDQDAHYFGIWINKRLKWTLSYMEGDWELVRCKTDESFNAEVNSLVEFFDEGGERNGNFDRSKFFILETA